MGRGRGDRDGAAETRVCVCGARRRCEIGGAWGRRIEDVRTRDRERGLYSRKAGKVAMNRSKKLISSKEKAQTLLFRSIYSHFFQARHTLGAMLRGHVAGASSLVCTALDACCRDSTQAGAYTKGHVARDMLQRQFSLCDISVFAKKFCYRSRFMTYGIANGAF